MLWFCLFACTSDPVPTGDTSTDSPVDSATDTDTNVPAEGTLLIEQIHLSGWSIGESMLIVGPGGASVLVDLGNDSHDDEVLDALDRRLGERAVDWVLLTHFHEDHVGGFDKLFEDAGVEVRQAVVHRGPFDLDESDTNPDSWSEVCQASGQVPMLELCTGAQRAPCDIETDGGPWPASACEGLTVDLGGGARLEVLAVDGFVGEARMDLPVDDENARSLVALLSFGDFDLLLGGDLTGGGKDTPDVEAFVASRVPLPPEGVDVLQLNHHGIDSSTHAAWLDAALPTNSRDRQVLVGANKIYLAAPDQDVLDRIDDRLGTGAVWITEPGSLAGEHDRLCEAGGSVTVRVVDGAMYGVEVDDGRGTCPVRSWTALSP